MMPIHSGAPHLLPLQFSAARRWHDLRAFVYDALADAMHHPAALDGARATHLGLLVSARRLVGASSNETLRQLEILSGDLRRMGVAHAIHQVVPGEPEPERHQLRITLRREPSLPGAA